MTPVSFAHRPKRKVPRIPGHPELYTHGGVVGKHAYRINRVRGSRMHRAYVNSKPIGLFHSKRQARHAALGHIKGL